MFVLSPVSLSDPPPPPPVCCNTTGKNTVALACALGNALGLAYTCSQEPFVTNVRVARIGNGGNIYTAKISKCYKSGFFFPYRELLVKHCQHTIGWSSFVETTDQKATEKKKNPQVSLTDSPSERGQVPSISCGVIPFPWSTRTGKLIYVEKKKKTRTRLWRT